MTTGARPASVGAAITESDGGEFALPGLPAGYRWRVRRGWFNYLFVHLEKLDNGRWTKVLSSKVVKYCWGEAERPNADELESCTLDIANCILAAVKNKNKMELLLTELEGVYESRRIG